MASIPAFWLQIVDKSGAVVRLPGGGALEADLIRLCTDAILTHGAGKLQAACTSAFRAGLDTAIDRCVDAIVAKGVGFGKTSAHVADDVRAGLRDVLGQEVLLTRQVTHVIDEAYSADELRTLIAEGLRQALQSLKDRTTVLA